MNTCRQKDERVRHDRRLLPLFSFSCLVLSYQGGGGLVEDGEGRLVVQQPSESEPLLLPEREQVGPVADGVETRVGVAAPHHRRKAPEIDLNIIIIIIIMNIIINMVNNMQTCNWTLQGGTISVSVQHTTAGGGGPPM